MRKEQLSETTFAPSISVTASTALRRTLAIVSLSLSTCLADKPRFSLPCLLVLPAGTPGVNGAGLARAVDACDCTLAGRATAPLCVACDGYPVACWLCVECREDGAMLVGRVYLFTGANLQTEARRCRRGRNAAVQAWHICGSVSKAES